MDIDDIRRANIRLLEKEASSARAAADRVGMTYVQYVNLRDGAKDSETGKPRGMRKSTAWKFEDKFGKPRGWLDQDHSQSSAPTEVDALIATIRRSSDEGTLSPQLAEQMRGMIEALNRK